MAAIATKAPLYPVKCGLAGRRMLRTRFFQIDPGGRAERVCEGSGLSGAVICGASRRGNFPLAALLAATTRGILAVEIAMTRPDDELASNREAAFRGEAAAVEQLVEEYVPRVRAFVRMRLGPDLRQREAASDIVQSTCRRLLAQGGRGLQFAGEAQFRGWLFTAALNTIKEKHRLHGALKRDMQRAEPIPEDSVMQLQAGYACMATPSRAAAAGEEVQRIEAAIDMLPADQREAISLCRLVGLPYEEVAERMDRSPEAVRKLLSRALRKLAQALK